LPSQRWHQGILTVHSFIELFPVCKCYGILTVHSVIKLFPVCKRRGTCCRLPLFICHPERESHDPTPPALHEPMSPDPREQIPPCASVEERPFRAASERLTERGFSPRVLLTPLRSLSTNPFLFSALSSFAQRRTHALRLCGRAALQGRVRAPN
jgi:hypothetical protein